MSSKGLEVKLTKKAFVITLPFSILEEVIKWSEDVEGECKITDMDEFTRDVLHELEREEENGCTPVMRMFDLAIAEAINQGSLGVSGEDDY